MRFRPDRLMPLHTNIISRHCFYWNHRWQNEIHPTAGFGPNARRDVNLVQPAQSSGL
jgi:hypothetical protein